MSVIKDFLQLGTLNIISRLLMAGRGLMIVLSLTPQGLGEYTIWLLFVFYFSILDLGFLKGLERDIPHFQAEGKLQEAKQAAQVGWGGYLVLCMGASLLLGIVTAVVFKSWLLGLLLGGYLWFDKWYRAYDSYTRIRLQYKENGIGQLIGAASSLIIIWFLLPHMGLYSIFIGFIISAILSIFYLHAQAPLQLRLEWSWPQVIPFIKSTVPLGLVTYAVGIFHAIAMTVLAWRWDKETLGYFAFAFRIFQILLAIFPYLIQDVVRTRMYQNIAQMTSESQRMESLKGPLRLYALVTVACWVLAESFGSQIIAWVAPLYVNSVGMLQVLILALFPLGVAKIFSDYLCSRVHQRMHVALAIWASGTGLQMLYLIFMNHDQIWHVPLVYVAATLIVYVMMAIAVVEHKFLQDFKHQLKYWLWRIPSLQLLLMACYYAQGRRPWSLGYTVYKYRYVADVIQHRLGAFNPPILPAGYGHGLDERCVEYPWVLSRLPAQALVVLDAGSILNHSAVLGLPLWQGRQLHITTLDDEGRAFSPHCQPVYTYQDLRHLNYGDGYFDAVLCVSTLEHVGMDNTFLYTQDANKKEHARDAYLTAVKELKRVLKKGGALYVTVPYGRYESHGWFQVFDAMMVKQLIAAFAPARCTETYFKYEHEQWQTASAQDCKDGFYFDIHTRSQYNKNFPAASQCVACVELVKG